MTVGMMIRRKNVRSSDQWWMEQFKTWTITPQEAFYYSAGYSWDRVYRHSTERLHNTNTHHEVNGRSQWYFKPFLVLLWFFFCSICKRKAIYKCRSFYMHRYKWIDFRTNILNFYNAVISCLHCHFAYSTSIRLVKKYS